jgi:hypothetical protein
LGKKAQLKKYTQNAIAIHVKRDRNSRKTRSQFTQNENVIHAKCLNDIPGRNSILRLARRDTSLSVRQAGFEKEDTLRSASGAGADLQSVPQPLRLKKIFIINGWKQ